MSKQTKYSVKQTGCTFKVHHKRHIHAIRSSKNMSKYSQYILDNKHSHGPKEDTMKIVHVASKSRQINTLEKFHIYKQGIQSNEIHADYTSTICDTILKDLHIPPRWKWGCEFSHLFPLERWKRMPVVEKLGQAHDRSQDSREPGGLEPQCAGCHATPVEVMRSGAREGTSPNSTLHRVGGKSPWCESATSGVC